MGLCIHQYTCLDGIKKQLHPQYHIHLAPPLQGQPTKHISLLTKFALWQPGVYSVVLYQPLEALHHDGGECYGMVIIEEGHCGFCRHQYNCSSL